MQPVLLETSWICPFFNLIWILYVVSKNVCVKNHNYCVLVKGGRCWWHPGYLSLWTPRGEFYFKFDLKWIHYFKYLFCYFPFDFTCLLFIIKVQSVVVFHIVDVHISVVLEPILSYIFHMTCVYYTTVTYSGSIMLQVPSSAYSICKVLQKKVRTI